MAKLVAEHAPIQADSEDYIDDERAFAARLRDFVAGQGSRLNMLAAKAAGIKDEYL